MTMRKVLIGSESAGAFGLCRFWRPNALELVLFSLLALLSPIKVQAAQKNVLILSGGRGRVSINQMESSLRAHFSGPVNFSIVDLENPRFGEKSYQENLAQALKGAYSTEKLDLIITVMTHSLHFAVEYRDKAFPGVPIVFMSVNNPLPEKMWPGVTGILSATGVHETIDLALQLHPDTQAVAVIGTSPTDYNWLDDYTWLQAEHSELLRHRDKVREIDLLGPATPELLEKVAELPPHTVVLFQLYPQDSNQPAFGVLDVLAAVTQRFPTYSILPHVTLGHGGIGGASYDPPTDSALAGELAARVLSGERPDDIPVVQNPRVNVSVDWRELRRWDIPESTLPPGTLVSYREPTLWERGQKYFVAGIAVILVQTLLIFALFWHRARKRRAEAELRKAHDAEVRLSRHLITAQEEERSRLASELHDDFSQRLAVLAFGLQNTVETVSDSPEVLKQTLDGFRESVGELGDDLHSLSHRLHSSTLDTLGLVAGLKSLCKEFGGKQGIEVDFTSEDIPRSVRPDVALCLFRITQEGLQNLKKHSGTKKAQLSVRHMGDRLVLALCDEGKGFDANTLEKPGLGILSMRGRARVLGGEFEIHSKPGKGTRIDVWVPLEPITDPFNV